MCCQDSVHRHQVRYKEIRRNASFFYFPRKSTIILVVLIRVLLPPAVKVNKFAEMRIYLFFKAFSAHILAYETSEKLMDFR